MMETPLLPRLAAALTAGAAIGFASGIYFSSLTRTGPVREALPLKDIAQRSPIIRAIDDAIEEPPRKRIRKLRLLLDEMEAGEIPKALEFLRAARSDTVLFNLELEFLAEWAATDPHQALAYAESYFGSKRREAITCIASSWVEADKTSGLNWLKSLRNGPLRAAAEKGIIDALALRDTPLAIELLKASPTSGLQDGWSSLFSTLAAEDPRRAIDAAMALPAGPARDKALQALVSAWGEADPKAAISWVTELPPSHNRDQALQNLANILGSEEPEAAIRLIMTEIPRDTDRFMAISGPVANWMRTDRATALAWVTQLPEGAFREAALSSAIHGWAQDDPEAATHYTLTLHEDNPSNQSYLFKRTLAHWIQYNPQRGLQWLDENADSINAGTYASIVTSLSYQYPAQASEVMARTPEGDLKNGIYAHFASALAQKDPTAANTWFDKMPDGIAREHFLEGMIGGMAIFDPEGAVRKLDNLPAGNAKGIATLHLASSWSYRDPEQAARWAASISDEAARRTALTEVIRSWVKRDEKPARRWIESSSAPAEWKLDWLKK